VVVAWTQTIDVTILVQPLVIAATGNYAMHLGSSSIYCRIGNQERMEPIEIRGNVVGRSNLIECDT
jgi:hypothetical protein